MSVLNFIINEIFGQGAIFLALIAMLGLILQKKSVGDIIRGTVMTAIGFFVLSQGTGIVTGNSIDGLASAFNTMLPQASGTADIDMSIYGTQIGIVMLLAFAANLVFARFTKWKTVFLTGHMLYWFPYVFIAAGVDAGLTSAQCRQTDWAGCHLYRGLHDYLTEYPVPICQSSDRRFQFCHRPSHPLPVTSGRYDCQIYGGQIPLHRGHQIPKELEFPS